MDYQPHGYEDDSESGLRRLIRVSARVDGQTHIYQFPPEESDRAVKMVKVHVEEGQVHPYAGLLLVGMIRGSE